MSRHYVLLGKNVVEVESATEWAVAFEKQDRRVDKTDVEGIDISTVFLGLDHQWEAGGPPLLFETMVFGGKHDGEQWRYSTWAEAQFQHGQIVEMIKGELNE